MTMNEKKYKRLEYLRHNINYLTIRARQEYYDLLNELKKAGNQSEPEEFEEFEVFQIKKTIEINHQKKKVNLLKKLNLARRKNVTG